MSFDWTVSLGNVLALLIYAGGVLWFLSAVKVRLEVFESDLKELNVNMRDMNQHVVESLVSAGRLGGLETRLNLLISRVDILYDHIKHAP